jgi:hypothetical protein
MDEAENSYYGYEEHLHDYVEALKLYRDAATTRLPLERTAV